MLDLERTGNMVEAGFWMIFGGVLIIASRRQRRSVKQLGFAACLISILFGLSDLVEASTGAWWRPWWLFVWKAACLVGLTTCGITYRTIRTRSGPAVEQQTQASSSSM